MDIGGKHHALLDIKRSSEDDEYIYHEFSFSWENSSLPRELGKFAKRDLNSIQTILNSELGTNTEAQLHDIGGRIWSSIPFPIRERLEAFDKKANELLSLSGSRMMLTIIVDKLDIPWELSRTPDKKSYWFMRYLIGREIKGHHHVYEPGKPEQERPKRILLAMIPFDMKRIKQMDAVRYKELKQQCDALKNLVKKINEEESTCVQVELLTYPTLIPDWVSTFQGAETAYDAIVYIGHLTSPETGGGFEIENPVSNAVEIVHPTEINASRHIHPMIFFDSCRTGVAKVSEATQESCMPIESLAEHFLAQNASAFIGTIQRVETVAATAFARYFLESLCLGGTSLSEALLQARNQVYKDFEGKNSELRRVHSCSYVLIGDNPISLHCSFLDGRKKVCLIWPEALRPYSEQFGTEIYPSGLDEVKSRRCDDFSDLKETFSDVKKEMAVDGDLVPIIDMPIACAAEIIGNAPEGEEWVIVSSVFRKRPDQEEAALYHVDKLEDLEYLYVEDYTSELTVMANAYIKANYGNIAGKAALCTQKNQYLNIYENMKKNMKNRFFKPMAFVLSGKHELEFDQLLDRQPSEVRKRLTKVSLHKEFKKILEMDQFQQYRMRSELPASVLVAYKKYVEKYQKLFVEVLSRWKEWTIECFEERYPDLYQRQEPLFSLTENCVETIIKFSKFVFDKQGLDNKVFGEELKIRRPLQESDFMEIRPRQLPPEAPRDLLTTTELNQNRKQLNQKLKEVIEDKLKRNRADSDERIREIKLDTKIPSEVIIRIKNDIISKNDEQKSSLLQKQEKITKKIHKMRTKRDYESIIGEIDGLES